jgi:hypothetical protein
MFRRAFGFGLGIAALGLSVFVTAAPGGSSIADAAMHGDRDTVRTLLKQAADVNAPQGDGMTALHWAAMKNDADLAETLLYAGANVRATTRIGGYTPLILAGARRLLGGDGAAPQVRRRRQRENRERHDGVDAGGAIGQRRRR